MPGMFNPYGVNPFGAFGGAFTDPFAMPAVPKAPRERNRNSEGGGGGKFKAKASPRAPHVGSLMAGATLSLPPDGSLIQMQDMQRKMLEMQSEILSLRTTQQQDQFMTELDQKQADAQNPLTYTEKADLVASITKLSPNDQAGVFDIIREGNPTVGAEDEIELDVDQIDTHTLRKLQRYVDSKKPGGRKTGSGAAAGGGYSEGAGAPAAKRSRVGDDGGLEGVNYANGGGVYGMPAPAAAPMAVSSAPAFRRDRAESLADDYDEATNGAATAAGAADVLLANASAWASTAALTASSMGGGGAGMGPSAGGFSQAAWGQASSEMQAKLDREQQRKSEVSPSVNQ